MITYKKLLTNEDLDCSYYKCMLYRDTIIEFEYYYLSNDKVLSYEIRFCDTMLHACFDIVLRKGTGILKK